MGNEVLYAFTEPNYRTSVCFSKSMEGLRSELEKLRAELVELESPEALDRLPEPPVAAALIGDKEHWLCAMIRALRSRGVKPILVGADPVDYGEGISGAALDRQTMVEHMVQYFCSAGRRRLAAVGNDPRDVNDNVRARAFLRHTRELGLPTSEQDVYTAETCLGGCIERFLNHAGNYDGAICANDFVAVQLILAARERGIGVPELLFVAGSGDQILGQCVTPHLTTSTQDFFQVGVQAASIWAYLDRNPTVSAMAVSVPCRIVCRESTACAPLPRYRITTVAPVDRADLTIPPSVLRMRRLEGCLLRCDEMDLRILRGVLDGISDDQIAERLFAAQGTVQYRLKKLYREAGVTSKRELRMLLRPYVTNPDFPEGFPAHLA